MEYPRNDAEANRLAKIKEDNHIFWANYYKQLKPRLIS